MPIRTPKVTIITRREGQRVALPAGVPVELSAAEIAHLDRDSPGALMPVRPEDDADTEANNPLVIPAEIADATETETEEERLAREAVERAKAGKPATKVPGKGKAGKPASGDADGL